MKYECSFTNTQKIWPMLNHFTEKKHKQTGEKLYAPNLSKQVDKKPFENIVGKEKNAGNQHFYIFPQCFKP